MLQEINFDTQEASAFSVIIRWEKTNLRSGEILGPLTPKAILLHQESDHTLQLQDLEQPNLRALEATGKELFMKGVLSLPVLTDLDIQLKKEPHSLGLAPPVIVTLKISPFLWTVHRASLCRSGTSGWQPSQHLQSFSPPIILSVKETTGAVLTLLQLLCDQVPVSLQRGIWEKSVLLKGERQENTTLSPSWIYYFRPYGGSLVLGNCHRETQQERKTEKKVVFLWQRHQLHELTNYNLPQIP